MMMTGQQQWYNDDDNNNNDDDDDVLVGTSCHQRVSYVDSQCVWAEYAMHWSARKLTLGTDGWPWKTWRTAGTEAFHTSTHSSRRTETFYDKGSHRLQTVPGHTAFLLIYILSHLIGSIVSAVIVISYLPCASNVVPVLTTSVSETGVEAECSGRLTSAMTASCGTWTTTELTWSRRWAVLRESWNTLFCGTYFPVWERLFWYVHSPMLFWLWCVS